ncbi:5-formyltetrahydrofolate cyclo-ligase [Kineococcus sp. T90]|nr:5-formyltetrahydrofolate cyclo-ligase [Kineococcus indalonis]
MEVTARKVGLRRALRAHRRARDAAEAAEVDAGVARTLLACPLVAGARRVALYSSLTGEPGTRSALAELRRGGVEVLLPVLLPDGDLDWEARPVRAGTAPGAGHGPGPLGPHAIATVDVVVVPALAVDTAGRRLGQGGGSYDRALRRVPPRVPVVALVHDDELFDAAVSPLPVLPHDRPVHAVVTPTRWMPLTA